MAQTKQQDAITPDSRIGVLLEQYPQLEQKLLQMSPAYSYLRNPILRRTVAKVATLRQVARIGDIPIATLINTLRQAAGIADEWTEQNTTSSTGAAPGWMQDAKVLQTLDARPIIAGGGHPMERVLSEMKDLPAGGIFLLVTPFLPAPLLDIIRKKGYEVWTETKSPALFENYLFKAH